MLAGQAMQQLGENFADCQEPLFVPYRGAKIQLEGRERLSQSELPATKLTK